MAEAISAASLLGVKPETADIGKHTTPCSPTLRNTLSITHMEAGISC